MERRSRRAWSRIALLSMLASLLLPAIARADDVRVEVKSKALHGAGKPALVIIANKPVASAVATLSDPKGQRQTLRSKAIAAGASGELPIDAPVGTTRYRGELEVVFADGSSGSMPLLFEVLVSKGFTIDPPPVEWIDPKAGTLSFTMGGVADRCEYEVLFDGKPARRGVSRFNGEAPGSKLTLRWATHGEDDVVLQVSFTCHDPDGFFAKIETFPWVLHIPHEEVIFATARSDVTAGESPKLDEAYEKIETAIRRYGKVVPIKLYVIGHTDTVGDAASNRTLSLARARSIAAYFRAKGVKVPILYTGMGESQLAVPTPDDTDEPRNRRADYVLKVDEPISARWTKL